MNKPSFIIIGAQRCGTTSLYRYVVNHPDIHENKTRKELHFFDNNKWYKKGIEKYWDRFPEGFTGEATPMYLFKPVVPQRIYKHLPDVKLIAILRNPVDRFVSQWSRHRKNGRDDRTFSEAVSGLLADVDGAQKNYLRRGLYALQLERYLELFDRKQLLVLQSERMFDNPASFMQDVFGFLNKKRYVQNDYGHHGVVCEKSGVDQKSLETLGDFYKPYNEALWLLLGEEWDW